MSRIPPVATPASDQDLFGSWIPHKRSNPSSIPQPEQDPAKKSRPNSPESSDAKSTEKFPARDLNPATQQMAEFVKEFVETYNSHPLNPSSVPPPVCSDPEFSPPDQDPAKKSRLNSPMEISDAKLSRLNLTRDDLKLTSEQIIEKVMKNPVKEMEEQFDDGLSEQERVYNAFAARMECIVCGFGDHMSDGCPIKGNDKYRKIFSQKYKEDYHTGLDWDPSKPLPKGYGWASYSSAEPERKDFAIKMYCLACLQGGHLSHNCPNVGSDE